MTAWADAEPPVGFLFRNKNAAFLNPDDEQITDYQALGWRGVHPFRIQYPDAPVYIETRIGVLEATEEFINTIPEPEQEP